ncbi:diguanylate cyclase [Acidithiobacillus sp. AMEEHan]|uniref:diguanylate cyclase n=1 Tax=Acidithiobacillus sp. AMEEHan TaxID=2994951 RepID=UPI0027E3BC00|nr:diguanylate cyclase [Acidithiobacillus sp. AMEEHan]
MSSDDAPRSSPGRSFWQRLGRPPQADQTVREQQQLLAWRGALSAVLVPAAEERQVLQRFCEITVQQGVADLAALLRPGPQSMLQPVALSGPRAFVSDICCTPSAAITDTQGPLGRAWREGRAWYSEERPSAAALAEWNAQAARRGLRASAILPVLRRRRIWALLLLARERQSDWPSDSQMLLESTAQLLGDVLEDLAKQQLQLILGSGLRAALDSVVLTDTRRRVLYVNQSFTLMTGYKEEEICHKGLKILLGPETSLADLASLDMALRDGVAWSGKLLNYQRNGQTFWNQVSIVPVRNAAEELTHFLGILRDVSREHSLLGQLEYEARHDRLTGLANRQALEEEMEQALARAQRNRSNLAVCFIDLDSFKPINDGYGHDAGDLVLQVVARRLREGLRRTDYVARLGGDEFVILLEGHQSREGLELVLEKLEILVHSPISLPNGQEVTVQLSMGITRYPEDGMFDAGKLLRFADQALYRAKALRNKRSTYWVYYESVFTPAAGAS